MKGNRICGHESTMATLLDEHVSATRVWYIFGYTAKGK